MKFLHTADWQLGKVFARISDEDKRAAVRQQRLAAVDRIASLAHEHAVDFVVVAGDLFESPSVSQATVSMACEAIGKIPVPVFAIPGNHDHAGPGSIWQLEFFLREKEALAPNLTVLLESQPFPLDGVILYPCPLYRRQETVDPTAWLRDPDLIELRHGPGDVRIVLAHGSTMDFGPAPDEDEEQAGASHLDLSRLPMDAIDYIALGDWHGAKQVGPKAWFSGTPEPDRFPRGQDYAPGNVLLVEAARGQPPGVQVLPTGVLGWHEFAFDLSGGEAVDRLGGAISERCGTRTGRDLLKLRLTGAIGIAAREQLDSLLDTYRSRLLRLDVTDDVTLAPTEEDIQAMTSVTDPIISRVARQLVEQASAEGDEAAVARTALLQLHAALR